MVGKTFTYLLGSDSSALLFNSKDQELNAAEVYGKLVTPVFGKGVAYDVPNDVSVWKQSATNCMLKTSAISKSIHIRFQEHNLDNF